MVKHETTCCLLCLKINNITKMKRNKVSFLVCNKAKYKVEKKRFKFGLTVVFIFYFHFSNINIYTKYRLCVLFLFDNLRIHTHKHTHTYTHMHISKWIDQRFGLTKFFNCSGRSEWTPNKNCFILNCWYKISINACLCVLLN